MRVSATLIRGLSIAATVALAVAVPSACGSSVAASRSSGPSMSQRIRVLTKALAEYVAELNRRVTCGFDPSVGATVLPHQVRARPRASSLSPTCTANLSVAARQTSSRPTGWVEVPPFNDEPFADHWLKKELA